jgi:hypothetical protein
MASGTGTGIIDFGASPGTNEASVFVSAPTIGASAHAEAFFQYDTQGVHSGQDHYYAALLARLVCAGISAGAGFTVLAVSAEKLEGQFKFHWVFAD